MSESLRVALLLDPLAAVLDEPLRLRVRWAEHAPMLARELMGRGHSVRGFGAPPGVIPHSSGEAAAAEDGGALRSRLLAFRPDVLVAYDPLSPAAVRGARMARKLDATLVLVEGGFSVSGRWHVRMRSRIGELLWGRYVRHTTDALVGLDEVARRQALREGFPAEIVSVVPHGVDLSEFRPGLASPLVARHRIRGRVLLYAGRLETSRGVEELLTAFARTVGQRSDWTLVMAGEGSARARLRATADRLGVAERVHWLPRPRREELPGLLGASTLLAVPARDDSALGRMVGRALACGVPVLASNLPRLGGLVRHGETGLLVEPGSAEEWTAAIRLAAGSPAARERWGRTGRALAEERLGWWAVAARFEEVLLRARRYGPRIVANAGRLPSTAEENP